MITTRKSVLGLIYAFIVWQVVGKDGKTEDGGNWVYIEEAWVHEDYEHLGILKDLVSEILRHKFCYKVKEIYWTRDKHSKVKKISLKGDNYGQ